MCFVGVPKIGKLTSRLDQKESNMNELRPRQKCIGQLVLYRLVNACDIRVSISSLPISQHL